MMQHLTRPFTALQATYMIALGDNLESQASGGWPQKMQRKVLFSFLEVLKDLLSNFSEVHKYVGWFDLLT